MVLPEALLTQIKQRARLQGLSITAYISQLVMRDLTKADRLQPDQHALEPMASSHDSDVLTVAAQIEDLRHRITRLEQINQGGSTDP
jgi:hypothetical protein